MPLSPDQERDYGRLKGLESILLKSPETELEFYEVLKKADPNIPIPKLEAHQAARRIKETEEEVKLLQQRLITRDAEAAIERQEKKLKRAPFNLSTEDIDAVKQIVAEKSKDGELISLETAAQFYIARRTPIGAGSSPKTTFSTRLQRPKNDFRKELRNPKSRLFTDTRNYITEQYDQAWDEGIEMINNQNP